MFMSDHRSCQRSRLFGAAERRSQHSNHAENDRRQKCHIESGDESPRIRRGEIRSANACVALESQGHGQPAERDTENIGETEGNMVNGGRESPVLARCLDLWE